MKKNLIPFLIILLISCNQNPNFSNQSEVKVAGAMKNVMWKGELGGVINLDSISKKGMYGLGPEQYLRGELLLIDGEAFVSRVVSKSEMTVEKEEGLEAPFFVYGQCENWQEIDLPTIVKSIKDIEHYVIANSSDIEEPFAFKLKGRAKMADIHIQNLPEGTVVTSPEEAHQGQTNYILKNEDVDIVGFFSTKHKGIFTHHDSYIHMHLINNERTKMGHLDQLQLVQNEMKLFLPAK